MLKFIAKRILSFKYAINGFLWALKTQGNLQFHLFALIAVVISGIFFRISNTEWLVVIICIGMVVASEIINSSIEELVNFISPERNQKAGLIKDLAAAAVLVTAVIAAVCGLIIFIPKLV
jgi:diacylglycerol kinase (ATP)